LRELGEVEKFLKKTHLSDNKKQKKKKNNELV